jgi:hypothetical protein
MPGPLVGALAIAVARAIAAQAAKQGVKKLATAEAQQIAKQIAAKRGVNKISNVQARRIAEQAAGPKARSMGGTAPLRVTKPKPGVRVTTITSKGTKVTGGIKRSTNKNGSAITIRKTTPRKAAEVRAEAQKIRRDRLRESLTPRVNPARPKTAPKRGTTAPRTNEREQEIIDRYYRIRFRDQGGPTPRSAQGKQSSIESRIASGSEKPTRGRTSSSNFDKEAESRVNLADKAARGNKKALAESKVKPGKMTKTSKAIRSMGSGRDAAIKGAIRNQRKVLRQREITQAAEAMAKAKKAK